MATVCRLLIKTRLCVCFSHFTVVTPGLVHKIVQKFTLCFYAVRCEPSQYFVTEYFYRNFSMSEHIQHLKQESSTFRCRRMHTQSVFKVNSLKFRLCCRKLFLFPTPTYMMNSTASKQFFIII